MKIEDAIAYFNDRIEYCKRNERRDLVDKYVLAIGVLKKQIPIKPRRYIDLYGHNKPGCPECLKNEILYAGQKFCSVCGTKIDWRGFKLSM